MKHQKWEGGERRGSSAQEGRLKPEVDREVGGGVSRVKLRGGLSTVSRSPEGGAEPGGRSCLAASRLGRGGSEVG